MKKIPTLFERKPDYLSGVIDEINPLCKWVADGEGVATRKYDGTAMMIDDKIKLRDFGLRRPS